MDKKVVVTVRYTDKDISTAIIEYLNSVLKFWVILPCIGIFIFGTLYAGVKNGFSPYLKGLLSVVIIIFILAVYYYYVRPIRGYQRVYQSRVESKFEFSIDNIQVIRDLSESSLKWDLFLRVIETKKYFYFEDQNKALTIIPKKCINNDEEVQVLREIVLYVKGKKYKRIGK